MNHSRCVMIENVKVGEGFPTFIVAEAGVNHNGDFALAKELVAAAQEAGAHAIKFQAFTATLLCDGELTETKNVEGITGGTKSSYEMYKKLELSNTQLAELTAYAQKKGILLFASVFDEARIDFLDSIHIPCYKISSGDLTHLPLLSYVARKRRPVIISTGLATLDEVEKAVHTLTQEELHDIIILHCTADYPPRDEEINLAVIRTLKDVFPYPIGFSDHSMGIEISLAACALGATVIEKHFTLNHDLDGPDHAMSLDPGELAALVYGIRRVERARGSGIKEPTSAERPLIYSGRRGIKAARDMKAGEKIRLEDIKIVKPESGLRPEYIEKVVGKKLLKDIRRNEPLEWVVIKH